MNDLISRQAAIEALREEVEWEYDWKDEQMYYIEADMAIGAIERLPSAQLEERTKERTETHACDLIKRQDAIDGTVIITVDDYTKVNRIIVKDESHFGCVFEPVDYDEEVGGTMTREEAIEWLIQIQDKYIHDGDEQFDAKRKEALGMAIEALKSDRPKGEWIKDEFGITVCSECKRPRRDSRVDHINFCNSCGARMINTK